MLKYYFMIGGPYEIPSFLNPKRNTLFGGEKRSVDEQTDLRKMHNAAIYAGDYPQDKAIQSVVKRSKRYTLQIIDCIKISTCDIPMEMTSTIEEISNRLVFFLHGIQKYSSIPSSIGINSTDKEFAAFYRSFSAWLSKYESRIMQDFQLLEKVRSFDRNIAPLLDMKIASKLGIEYSSTSKNNIWNTFQEEIKKVA